MTAGADIVRFVIACALAASGLLLVIGGAIGVLRFPDPLARAHATRAASFGAPLILAGLGVDAWDAGLAVRLALLAAAIAVTGPALTHLIAHAAHRIDVEPEARR